MTSIRSRVAYDMLLLEMSYVCMLSLRKGGQLPVSRFSLAIRTWVTTSPSLSASVPESTIPPSFEHLSEHEAHPQ